MTVKSPLAHNFDDGEEDDDNISDPYRGYTSSPLKSEAECPVEEESPERKPFNSFVSSPMNNKISGSGTSSGFQHDVHAKVLSEMQIRGSRMHSVDED